MRQLIVIMLLTAAASAAPPTQIVGKLTDRAGRPLESATVTAAAATAITNANGIYRLVVPAPGNYDVTFSYADAVIVIHDPRPMVVPPKPARKHEERILPPYSDAAIEHDAWEKAWLLLDVDADGTVTRLKFLHEPGHDLKDIAQKAAFAMKFEPGRDAENRPMPVLVLWAYEWPAYWWLVQMEGVTTAFSPQAYSVPCRGSGPVHIRSVHPIYRDCSPPDRELAVTAKWIPR